MHQGPIFRMLLKVDVTCVTNHRAPPRSLWSNTMTRRLFPLAFAAAALTAACNSDGSLAPSSRDPMVGTWISSGSDVALGLSTSLRAAMDKATFRDNATYSIEI